MYNLKNYDLLLYYYNNFFCDFRNVSPCDPISGSVFANTGIFDWNQWQAKISLSCKLIFSEFVIDIDIVYIAWKETLIWFNWVVILCGSYIYAIL